MKLSGTFYEFNVSDMALIIEAIKDLPEEKYDHIPVKEAVIHNNRISVQYDSENFYRGTNISGFIYDDNMTFLGKVHYKKNHIDFKDDIRGKFMRTENGLFIWGVWEYEDGKYGFAIDLFYC